MEAATWEFEELGGNNRRARSRNKLMDCERSRHFDSSFSRFRLHLTDHHHHDKSSLLIPLTSVRLVVERALHKVAQCLRASLVEIVLVCEAGDNV